jgi:hypothetical protein
MKTKIILTSIAMLCLTSIYAQKGNEKDTLLKVEKRDTIRIGGLIITTRKDKNNKPKEVIIDDSNDSLPSKSINEEVRNEINKRLHNNKRKRNAVRTNWFAFDLGFNNYEDATNYSSTTTTQMLRTNGTQAAPNKNDFKLNTGKSINFNLWIVSQKINLAKDVLGLKYAIGIESNNFRFKSPLVFKDAAQSFIVKDSISFSKNKLAVNYLTVPLMLTLKPSQKAGISLSAGISAGYRYSSINKQQSGERGKQKNRGDFDLNPWKLAAVGDIGFKLFRLYGSYSLTNLHSNGLEFTPYSIGLRFNKW